MKKIISIIALIIVAFNSMAELPKPSETPEQGKTSMNRPRKSEATGSVGTATVMMLSLAGGVLIYKLRKKVQN
ncbi:MAG: hypothetical protein IJ748_08050 [Bacteroidales bacterium]|nr:hypothetical protein [Bacteroidales bacterium]